MDEDTRRRLALEDAETESTETLEAGSDLLAKHEAAAHWEQLADQEDEGGDREEARGSHAGAYRVRAATYRRTAQSIRLEIETGLPHCTVCLGAHRNRECPRRPGAS